MLSSQLCGREGIPLLKGGGTSPPFKGVLQTQANAQVLLEKFLADHSAITELSHLHIVAKTCVWNSDAEIWRDSPKYLWASGSSNGRPLVLVGFMKTASTPNSDNFRTPELRVCFRLSHEFGCGLLGVASLEQGYFRAAKLFVS